MEHLPPSHLPPTPTLSPGSTTSTPPTLSFWSTTTTTLPSSPNTIYDIMTIYLISMTIMYIYDSISMTIFPWNKDKTLLRTISGIWEYCWLWWDEDEDENNTTITPVSSQPDWHYYWQDSILWSNGVWPFGILKLIDNWLFLAWCDGYLGLIRSDRTPGGSLWRCEVRNYRVTVFTLFVDVWSGVERCGATIKLELPVGDIQIQLSVVLVIKQSSHITS